MPEIEITVDQREYLEDLQAELEEDVVYGHVRLTDALQFLIDSREEELTAEEEAVGSVPADDEAVDDPDDDAASDEEDAEAESNGEDGQDDDAGDADAGDVDDAVDNGLDGAEADETDDGGEPDAEPDEDDADADDDDANDDEDAEPAAAPTPGGGGDRLNAMMQLLDTHDEKWREASGDARYEVDLPDGSTETANTKDDVRALLFKSY